MISLNPLNGYTVNYICSNYSIGDVRQGTVDRRPETVDGRPETRNRETVDRRQKTGDRRKE